MPPKNLSDQANSFLQQPISHLSYKGTDTFEGVKPLRKAFDDYFNSLIPAIKYTASIEEVVIDTVSCTKVFSELSTKVIIYLHPGGFAVGSSNTMVITPIFLNKFTGFEVISIDYSLAPEKPFPAALNDIAIVYQALLNKGYSSTDIRIFGESAGGNLAVASIHYWKEKALPLPQSVGLVSAMLDLTCSGDTHETLKAVDPVLSSLTQYGPILKAYANNKDLTDPLISPLFGDFSTFPATLIQIGSREILLSENCLLANKIRASGGTAILEIGDGLWHLAHTNPLLPEGLQSLQSMSAFLSK